MIINQFDINELKELYRKAYGKDLSNEDAWEMGNRLVRAITALARIPESEKIPKKFEPRST